VDADRCFFDLADSIIMVHSLTRQARHVTLVSIFTIFEGTSEISG